MNKKHIIYIIFFIFSNILLGNSFLFENKLIFKAIKNQQDTTLEDKTDEQIQSKRSFKSPGKALLYSSVLPGIGQAYMGNWMRALLFVSLDVAAIGTWYHNNNLSGEKKKEYSYYAKEHWNFGSWVHDYYRWFPEDPPDDFLGDEELWDSIREVFVNKSDSINRCHEPPYCYLDIWDHSHSVEFYYDGDLKSSSSVEFKDIFKDLCDNVNTFDQKCSVEVVDLKDNNGDSIYVAKDHHFYEGIQKYDMFFAGWGDAVDSVEVLVKQNGDIIATSPNQISYRKLWGRYRTIKTLAVNSGKFMLINRVISMVDALLLAKKWNNKQDVKLSLNAYPDLRNKSGIGGVTLSLKWK